MLRLANAEEKFRLDSDASAMFRTALAPEDVLGILRTPNLKLRAARNPSALLVGMAKDQAQRARVGRLLALVPMLRRIDKMRDLWGLDEEAEGLLKFGIPSTVVLQWLDEVAGSMRESGATRDAAIFVKSRLRRMILDLRAAEVGPGPPPSLSSRRDETDRSRGRQRSRSRSRQRTRSRSRERWRDGAQGPGHLAKGDERREVDRPLPGNHGRRPQQAVSEEQLHQQVPHAQSSLRAVPPPVAPAASTGGKITSSGKGIGKGSSKGLPSGLSGRGSANAGDNADELMVQIQRLQSQLETAKRGL